jgi:hypothetical protein
MTLLSILLVAKTGVVNAINVKEFGESDLYKRAGFKHVEGFEQRAVYPHGSDMEIHVYGKVSGRAGQENKYEFPPPIAETLFFGTVVLVAKEMDTPTNLTIAEWEVAYQALMGGFEDLGTEDTETTISSASSEEQQPLTRDGYVKDDFVVDEDPEEEEEEEEEERMVVLKKSTKKGKVALKKRITKPKTSSSSEQVFLSATRALTEPENVPVLDCSNELTEEEYV